MNHFPSYCQKKNCPGWKSHHLQRLQCCPDWMYRFLRRKSHCWQARGCCLKMRGLHSELERCHPSRGQRAR
jgi:hypothetical protein